MCTSVYLCLWLCVVQAIGTLYTCVHVRLDVYISVCQLKSHNKGVRSSPTVVALRHIYVDMKVWSRMFAVNVQSVSVQQVNWKLISWCTWATNRFAVVHVVNISVVSVLLKVTLEDVLISWDLTVFNLLVFVTCESFWLCHAGLYVDCRL